MDRNYGLPRAPGNISPALFQAMVEQAGDAIIFIDSDGAIQAWNRGAEVIFGYTAAEALANSLDVIIPEPLRKAHWAGFHKAIEMGHTRNGDKILTTRAIHKDGRKVYVDLHFCIIKDDSGTAAGALAIGRDCTERYLAEKARNKVV